MYGFSSLGVCGVFFLPSVDCFELRSSSIFPFSSSSSEFGEGGRESKGEFSPYWWVGVVEPEEEEDPASISGGESIFTSASSVSSLIESGLLISDFDIGGSMQRGSKNSSCSTKNLAN